MADEPPYGAALGLLETHGLGAAVEGLDAMLKAAEVRLVRQERTVPALITSMIAGETAAVRAALDAGRAAAERVGRVVSAHVIPRPADEVWVMLTVRASRPAKSPSGDGLDAQTVSELRRLARARADERFTGRAISRAAKDDLLRFLRAG